MCSDKRAAEKKTESVPCGLVQVGMTPFCDDVVCARHENGTIFMMCPIDVRRAIPAVRSPSGGNVEADTLPHLFLSRRVASQAGHPAADGERGRSPLWLTGEAASVLAPTNTYFSTQEIYHARSQKTRSVAFSAWL